MVVKSPRSLDTCFSTSCLSTNRVSKDVTTSIMTIVHLLDQMTVSTPDEEVRERIKNAFELVDEQWYQAKKQLIDKYVQCQQLVEGVF